MREEGATYDYKREAGNGDHSPCQGHCDSRARQRLKIVDVITEIVN